MLNVKEGQLLTVYLRKEGKILKRLHPITLVTLCVSIIFSTLPAYASETTQGSSAVEVTASDREIAANISDEGESEVTTVEEDIDHLDDAEQDVADGTIPDGTEVAAAPEAVAVDVTTAESVAADAATTADVATTADAATTAEAAATEVTAEAATAAAEAAEEAAEAAAAEAAPESRHVASPALQSVAGAVEEKVAQMKLEVIDYLDEGFGDGQMLSSGGSRLLIDTYSGGSWNALNNWLNDRKYTDFDIYISHYHGDHMGNVENILNDGKYKVNKLYLPDYGYMTGSNSYMKDYRNECESMMNTASSKGVKIVQLVRDSVFTVGDVLVLQHIGEPEPVPKISHNGIFLAVYRDRIGKMLIQCVYHFLADFFTVFCFGKYFVRHSARS